VAHIFLPRSGIRLYLTLLLDKSSTNYRILAGIEDGKNSDRCSAPRPPVNHGSRHLIPPKLPTIWPDRASHNSNHAAESSIPEAYAKHGDHALNASRHENGRTCGDSHGIDTLSCLAS